MKLEFQLSRIETSKKLLLVSYIICLALTAIVVVGTFQGFDMSNVTNIALASYAEVAASNVWYYKKATRENVFKNIPKKYLEDVDINQLL